MDADALHDLFAAFGPITIKRMFGGQAIYADGLIIGVVVDEEIYLKGDAQSGAAMEAAGGARWLYAKDGRPISMPYWRVPSTAMDDAEDMAGWARLALEASRKAEALKAAKKPARKAGSLAKKKA